MIDVLLATYNSAHYLRTQLDSLIGQTCHEWRLLIHDAGSTDDTPAIIASYVADDSRLHYLGSHRLGAVENFAYLWARSDAEYVMFCDHDDVWMPDKIARTMTVMKEAEAAEENRGKGIMVFTDACVADENLEPLCPSSWAWQGLDPKRRSLGQLLVQNVAAGNTMLMNRKLRELCGEIPSGAVMHDHWISLLACTLGVTVCLSEPTLLYRQHRNNIFGASHYSLLYFLKRAWEGWYRVRARFYLNVAQADAFVDCYGPLLRPSDLKCLKAFASLRRRNWLMRRYILIRWGIRKAGLVRNLATLLIA